MTAAGLSEVLEPARRGGYAVAGLVALGWEDARAYVAAAEMLGAPLILQAGPGCRAHTPLRVLGPMFRALADASQTPVALHLDHSRDLDECRAAIEAGFTSIMFDGSASALERNIEATRAAVELARAHGVDVEGELGVVGYAGGEASARTDPAEAAQFWRETGVAALAVSVGNVHLQQERAAEIDVAALRAIRARVEGPLVLHGGSGVPVETRRALAREGLVSKFNIGTELRLAFGAALRGALASRPEVFDRIEILRAVEAPLRAAAADVISALYGK